MSEYHFFYDESEHTRKITRNTFETFTNENYEGNFIATICGWSVDSESKIKELYLAFEDKYSDRKDANDEIKSKVIKIKDYGFSTLSKHKIPFIKDLLTILDNPDIHFYFSIINKIEYLVSQIVRTYNNNIIYNADAMKYTIVKAITTYHPKNVIDSIYENPKIFSELLKLFFRNQILEDNKNYKLKHREINAFKDALVFLESVQPVSTYDWDYNIAFDGFLPILKKAKLDNYSLGIDKETDTFLAAKNMGLKNPYELDSQEHFGIRISDMISGIINKLIRALHKDINDKNSITHVTKKILDAKWFDMNEQQFELYKILRNIIIKENDIWSEIYSGLYADDAILHKSYLSYITYFESAENMRAFNIDLIKDSKGKNNISEQFNTFLLNQLQNHYKMVFPGT